MPEEYTKLLNILFLRGGQGRGHSKMKKVLWYTVYSTMIVLHVLRLFCSWGGIRGTVVARWTAGQQVERSILRQGHGSYQNSSHSPRLSPAQFSLTVHNRGLKHQSFILFCSWLLDLLTSSPVCCHYTMGACYLVNKWLTCKSVLADQKIVWYAQKLWNSMILCNSIVVHFA